MSADSLITVPLVSASSECKQQNNDDNGHNNEKRAKQLDGTKGNHVARMQPAVTSLHFAKLPDPVVFGSRPAWSTLIMAQDWRFGKRHSVAATHFITLFTAPYEPVQIEHERIRILFLQFILAVVNNIRSAPKACLPEIPPPSFPRRERQLLQRIEARQHIVTRDFAPAR